MRGERGMVVRAAAAGALHKLTMLLKEYASVHDLAVVVTNHVVDSMRREEWAGTTRTRRGRWVSLRRAGGAVAGARFDVGQLRQHSVIFDETRQATDERRERRGGRHRRCGVQFGGEAISRRLRPTFTRRRAADFRIGADGVWDD